MLQREVEQVQTLSWGVADSCTGGTGPHIEAGRRRVVPAEVWTVVPAVMAVLAVNAHVALVEPGH